MRLYLISLPEAPLPEDIHNGLASLLLLTAQERIKKFRLPEDTLRSLVGRLAPIWFLRKERLIQPGTIPVFDRRGKGKPYLKTPDLNPPIDFNTSHDGSYVLLGVHRGANCEIGVDLMRLPENPEEIQEGISEQLSHAEKHSLALPMTTYERSKRITTLWTFKECYTKAIGEGVGFGLDRIDLTLGPNGEVEGVCVDGEDVRFNGWQYAFGLHKGTAPEAGASGNRTAVSLDDGPGPLGKAYGWTVFWRGEKDDNWDGELIHVSWEDFLADFRDTNASS